MEKQIVFPPFSKVNQNVREDAIQINELQYTRNAVISKIGKYVRRGGFDKLTTNPSPYDILYIGQIPGNAAGLSYSIILVLVNDAGTYKLYYTTTQFTSFTQITGVSLGSVMKLLNKELRRSVVSVENYPLIYHEINSNWYVDELIMEAPDISGYGTKNDVLGTSHAGTMGDGSTTNNRYKYLFVCSDEFGNKSLESLPLYHFMVDDAPLSGGRMSVYLNTDERYMEIQKVALSVDNRVKKLEIYRSKRNTDELYFVAYTQNDAISFFDENGTDATNADSNLFSMFLYNYDIKSSKAITHHNTRIFFGNVTIEDKLYINPQLTNGTVNPTGSLELHHNLEILNLTAGSLKLQINAIYKYRFYFVDADGRKSKYIEKTVTSDANGYGFEMQRLPEPPKDCMLIAYRTVGGSSTYKRTKLSASAVDYDYLTKEQILTIQYFSDTQPDASLGAEFTDNVDKLYESAVIYSEPGKDSTFPVGNIFNIFPLSGDEIMDLFDDGDGVLIIKKNSICKLFTSDAVANWRAFKYYDNLGSTYKKGAIMIDRSVYFFYNSEFYVLRSDKSRENVGLEFKSSLSAITNVFDSCFYKMKNWIVYSVQTSTAYALYIYDLNYNQFFIFDIPSRAAVASVIDSSGIERLVISIDKNLYYYNDQIRVDDFVPNDYSMNVKTKLHPYVDGFVHGRARELFIKYNKITEKEVSVTLYDENDNNCVYQESDDETDVYKRLQIESFTSIGSAPRESAKFSLLISGEGLEEVKDVKLVYDELTERKS